MDVAAQAMIAIDHMFLKYFSVTGEIPAIATSQDIISAPSLEIVSHYYGVTKDVNGELTLYGR